MNIFIIIFIAVILTISFVVIYRHQNTSTGDSNSKNDDSNSKNDDSNSKKQVETSNFSCLNAKGCIPSNCQPNSKTCFDTESECKYFCSSAPCGMIGYNTSSYCANSNEICINNNCISKEVPFGTYEIGSLSVFNDDNDNIQQIVLSSGDNINNIYQKNLSGITSYVYNNYGNKISELYYTYNDNLLKPIAAKMNLGNKYLNTNSNQNLGLGIYLSETGTKFKIYSDDYSDERDIFSGYILAYIGNTNIQNLQNGFFGLYPSSEDFSVQFIPNNKGVYKFNFQKK